MSTGFYQIHGTLFFALLLDPLNFAVEETVLLVEYPVHSPPFEDLLKPRKGLWRKEITVDSQKIAQKTSMVEAAFDDIGSGPSLKIWYEGVWGLKCLGLGPKTRAFVWNWKNHETVERLKHHPVQHFGCGGPQHVGRFFLFDLPALQNATPRHPRLLLMFFFPHVTTPRETMMDVAEQGVAAEHQGAQVFELGTDLVTPGLPRARPARGAPVGVSCLGSDEQGLSGYAFSKLSPPDGACSCN